MRAIVITRPGGPEVLIAATLQTPVLGPGEVLIRVAGAGVNFPDLLQRAGRYDPPPDASPLPGLEVAGVIAGLGSGVRNLTIGDKVVALCNGGGYAEYVAIPAGQVLPLPAGLTLIEGAALPETFFTIAQTLVMRAGVEPGMFVLVQGAAGGLGGAALQIARALEGRPIALVSTPDKAAYALERGAEAVIDHTREDIVARVLDLTGGRGADRIVAIAGGEALARNMQAAARLGVIVQLATLGGDKAEIPLGLLLAKGLTLIGSMLRPQSSATKAAIADTLRTQIWPHFSTGRIRAPRVQTVPIEQAHRAHAALHVRNHLGKIVLVTDFGAARD